MEEDAVEYLAQIVSSSPLGRAIPTPLFSPHAVNCTKKKKMAADELYNGSGANGEISGRRRRGNLSFYINTFRGEMESR